VRIHYADSLKFFLSLYGHKYPVSQVFFIIIIIIVVIIIIIIVKLDVSSDEALVITASMDKNIKVSC